MSFLYDDATGEAHYLPSNPLGAVYPATMGIWFKSDDIAITQWLLGIVNSGANDQAYGLLAAGAAASDPVQYVSDSAGAFITSTSSGYSANIWHHAYARFVGTGNCTIYIDGGSAVIGSGATPTGLNRVAIGRREDSTPDGPASARLAEAAIWNVDIGEGAASELFNGIAPYEIRPASLQFYAPLIGVAQDLISGTVLTASGTPDVDIDHPPVAHLEVFQTFQPEAAGGGGAPRYAGHLAQLLRG